MTRFRPQARARRTLDRALAQTGLCSRAQAEKLIRAGRVRVNGALALDPARWVDSGADAIAVDGRALASRERVVLALNKPLGYVTTRSDPRGRKTVYDLLGERASWVAPVGRLDRDTRGLLLFTNDSALAARITAPESKLSKTYRVEARGALDDEALERLRGGVELDGSRTRPAELTLLRRGRTRTLFELTIVEGKNRQVRRMLSAVGSKVLALERTAIGPLRLAGLELGTWRELPPSAIAALDSATRVRRRV